MDIEDHILVQFFNVCLWRNDCNEQPIICFFKVLPLNKYAAVEYFSVHYLPVVHTYERTYYFLKLIN